MSTTLPTLNREEFLAFGEAALLYGTTLPLLRRAVARGLLPVYHDDLDRRLKLVRVEDMDRLHRPRLADSGSPVTRVTEAPST